MGERLPRDIDCVCKDREVEFIRWVWETVGHARLELRALGGAGLCHGKGRVGQIRKGLTFALWPNQGCGMTVQRCCREGLEEARSSAGARHPAG